MTEGRYAPAELVLLDPERHDRGAFNSGEPSLDRYIRHQATQDISRQVCRVYVYAQPSSGRILGYYTLSAWTIEPAALPEALLKRLPRYNAYPATLIGRLAVDREVQGPRIGSRLIADGTRRSAELATSLGILAVVVEALDESAATYYRRFGFSPFVDYEMRLFLTVADIRRFLDAAG